MSIYLDNPATSWPKPPEVLEAMNYALLHYGSNPGRAGHDGAIATGEMLFRAREELASFFSSFHPMGVCFMKNITEALNTVIHGIYRPGDHFICSSLEHNSVMRPLRYLQEQGLELTQLSGNSIGLIDPQDLRKNIRKNTKLVIINHGSNVTGALQPIGEIGQICRKLGILFLVDSAQTAGKVPIDISRSSVDILAFTGHKSLLGPMGIGGLVLNPDILPGTIDPIIRGGTGSLSEEEQQPDFYPDALESGTPNIPGVAGLLAGLQWVKKEGLKVIQKREEELTTYLYNNLRSMDGLLLHGTEDKPPSLPVLSCSIPGKSVSEVGGILNDCHGIFTRVGLHCAPSAHKKLGTYPHGTVRLGPGYFNTYQELDRVSDALSDLCQRKLNHGL